jgi:DNA-binding NtrC family response regulator
MATQDWHLLVIEDDPDGREVVGRILRHHKITMDTANTAEDALELLKENNYTAAIVDLSLPGMDGWTLLKHVQRQSLSMPCIAITAYHSAEVAVEAITAGFHAYFPKPLEPTSFVRELTTLIG